MNVFITVYCVIFGIIWTVRGDSHESLVHSAVFKDYNTCIRPVQNSSSPITVEISLVLQSVYGVEEKHQTLYSSVGIELTWVDEFLSWNSTNLYNVDTILVPLKLIWRPDICIENDLSDNKCLSAESVVQVSSEGQIKWRLTKELRTECEIDITEYPFDRQSCEIRVGTLYSTDQKIRFRIKQGSTISYHFKESGEWKLMGKNFERVQYTFAQKNFTYVKVKYDLERLTSFHVNTMIIPLIILSCLNLACYCIPFDCGEKVSASIEVFLAFAFVLIAINDEIPTTSRHIFTFGLLMSLQLIFSALSVIINTFLSYLYHHNSDMPVSTFFQKLYLTIHGTRTPRKGNKPTEVKETSTSICDGPQRLSRRSNKSRESGRYNKRDSTRTTASSIRSRHSKYSVCSQAYNIDWTLFAIELERKAFIVMLILNILSYLIFLCIVFS
ncbi:neuronal acetylcholine receptor subunit alpha-6-like [Saccostrea echinata]|uniref:neuronal acetylcholine receptor subunit alpha-6-like n=1 Tax=Saccostrea echinata TaxID=191078 RepID=UPI002A81CC09|nr:neuronal acetylcholine receptor subunit alpha-6-like [Saccostrea echinata]